jgi:hypothetical protein
VVPPDTDTMTANSGEDAIKIGKSRRITDQHLADVIASSAIRLSDAER